ncbi:MAG: peptidylprolyl isomerase [Pleurocapsa sp. MO_226.B13]|nr:peptidylprolyl isomerase [Pleurocapsa sp. MO_226.B13]
MTLAIQSHDRTITAWDIIPRLARYQMLPQLIKESIIDEAIETIECTAEEINAACQIFYQQNQLHTETQRQDWAINQGMNQTDLEEIATRQLKIEKLKLAKWESVLEGYFLQRKSQLDKISFSIIRTSDRDLAQEIYFRIQDREQTFAELAQQYSEGIEANMGGMVAPVELGSLPPAFARLLQNRQPGELLPPFPMGEHTVVIQIERVMPAKLDSLTRKRLLHEQFQAWLQKQIKERGIAIKNLQLN